MAFGFAPGKLTPPIAGAAIKLAATHQNGPEAVVKAHDHRLRRVHNRLVMQTTGTWRTMA